MERKLTRSQSHPSIASPGFLCPSPPLIAPDDTLEGLQESRQSSLSRMPSREQLVTQLCYRRGIGEASTSRLHKSSPDVHQSPPDLPRAREEGLRRPSSGTNQSARSKSRTAQLAVSADTTSHSASGKASPKIVSPRSPDVEMLTWETREAANTLMRQRLEMYRACLAAESMERPSPPGRDGGSLHSDRDTWRDEAIALEDKVTRWLRQTGQCVRQEKPPQVNKEAVVVG